MSLLLALLIAIQDGTPGAPRTEVASTQVSAPGEVSLPDDLQTPLDEIASLQETGELDGARARLRELVDGAAFAGVIEERGEVALRALAAVDDAAWTLGELPVQLRVRARTVELLEDHLEPDDPELVAARSSMGSTQFRRGDLAAARDLFQSVLASRVRTLPEGHPEIVSVQGNLALTLTSLGDLDAARSLGEAVLAAREAALPADDPAVVTARGNLASTLYYLGDLGAARPLLESVLATRERTLPEDHHQLTRARNNLAAVLVALGDLEGARALEQAVLASRERTLPEDHPDLVRARGNLAHLLFRLEDFAGARLLEESVLASRERTLPEDHPELVIARANLALTLWSLGEVGAARALEESVLASRERTLPADHDHLLAARSNLGLTLRSLGELDAARALAESVVASRERTLPPGHPELGRSRSNLAATLCDLGDLEAARALLPELATGQLRELASLVATSPREARAIAGRVFDVLWISLFLDEIGASRDRRPWAFELVESVRHLSQASSVSGASTDSEVGAWREEAASLRAQLNDVVSGGASTASAESLADEVARLSTRRDHVERRIRARLAEGGRFLDAIRADDLAAALAPGTAAVAFLRYGRGHRDPEERRLRTTQSLLAHVVLPGARPVRVELGRADEVEARVRAWRAALGAQVKTASRGRSVAASSGGDERTAGAELRRAVLDPVLAAVGDARTLHVCLDDVLHLVPLDALPLEGPDGGGDRVGDRYTIVGEVSFARPIAPPAPLASDTTLVAIGDPSFDAGTGAAESGVIAAVARAGLPAEGFRPLSGTRREVEALADLFEERFGKEAERLVEGEATRSALHARAPGARFLHLATHGWFAPEIAPAQPADGARDALWRRAGHEAVAGLAPMTLCGLALAGANRGADERGRVPGIVTAEELASIDLSRCELAVLSACETNVGVRSAGQGIQSLQSALHAAGARTAITSLWRVDDAATQRLMEAFYAALWVDGLGVADALWRAKTALRAAGHPVRDWAGWVLTGARH